MIKYANPMITAQSIADMLNNNKKRYSPRPWNPYKPEETLWWLVPSTEWPAYKYGKFVFFKDADSICCGLNIEKGFSGSVPLAYPATLKRGLIMDDTWIWSRFLRDMGSGYIDAAVSRIQEKTNAPAFVDIGASTASDPTDFDPHKTKAFKIRLKIENNEINIFDDSEAGFLAPLLKIKTLSEIPELFSSVDALDWMWIDFDIYTKMKAADTNDNAKNEIIMGSNELFENVLQPLENWCHSDLKEAR